MAINYSKIPIGLRGINQKVDNKQMVDGGVFELENMWVEKTGKLQKRRGLDLLEFPTIEERTPNTVKNFVSEFYNSPVHWLHTGYIRYLTNNTNVSYLQNANWFLGAYDIKDLYGNLNETFETDYVEGNDYGLSCRLVKYTTTTGTDNYLEVTFYDKNTKKPFFKTTLFEADTFKLTSSFGGVQIWYKSSYYGDSGVRGYKGFDANGNPNATLSVDTGTIFGAFDAYGVNQSTSTYCVAYVTSGATPNTYLYSVNEAGTLTTTSFATFALADVNISNEKITYFDSIDVKIQTYLSSGALFGTPVTVHTSSNVDRVSSSSGDIYGITFVFISENSFATKGTATLIYKSTSPTTYALVDVCNYTKMASRSFRTIAYEDNVEDICIYLSKPEESGDSTNIGIALVRISLGYAPLFSLEYEIYKSSEYLLPSKGTNFDAGEHFPTVIVDEYGWTTVFKTKLLDTVGAKIATRKYASEPTFAYWNGSQLNNVTPNLRIFDGVNNSLVGWPVYPSKPISVTPSGAGSNFPAGTYGIRLCYKRVDRNGNISRSAPSLALSYALGSTATTFTISLRPYPFSDAPFITIIPEILYDEYIEVYVTQNNGAVYYFDGQINLNKSDGYLSRYDQISYDRKTVNASITNNRILYTEGGILEHIGPEAVNYFCVSRDRVFAVTSDNGRSWYSKARIQGEMPNFTDAFVIDYQNSVGLKSCSVMDDKTILFGEESIYVVYGVGPDETGAGNYEYQEISNEAGTAQPRSVNYSSLGVLFMSIRGIYLLDKGLQIQFIGANVEDFKVKVCVGSVSLTDREHTVFAFSDGSSLVYDEYHGQWYKFSITGDIQFNGLASVDGRITYATKSDIGTDDFRTPRVLIESVESDQKYTDTEPIDGDTDYICKINTGWINVAGIQGFNRVRKISIVGDTATDDTSEFFFKKYTNYDDTTFEQVSILNSQIKTVNNRSQIEYKPKIQRMESFRLEIFFTTSDNGFSISNLSIEAGAIEGLYRQTTTKRAK